MNESTQKAIDSLSNILIKIIDAKEKKNLTEENKKIALQDILKLLNRSMEVITSTQELQRLNIYQNLYFQAIKIANKNVEYKLVEINDNLWRVYVISLFKQKGLNDILKKVTGWDAEELDKEKITYDMKILMLSMLHFEDKE